MFTFTLLIVITIIIILIMGYTGFILVEKQDTNPNSATYGQTRTDREPDTAGTCKFHSAEITDRVYRNNCPTGYADTVGIVYTLEAGAVTSLESQAAADLEARALFDTQAQTEANSTRTCTATGGGGGEDPEPVQYVVAGQRSDLQLNSEDACTAVNRGIDVYSNSYNVEAGNYLYSDPGGVISLEDGFYKISNTLNQSVQPFEIVEIAGNGLIAFKYLCNNF